MSESPPAPPSSPAPAPRPWRSRLAPIAIVLLAAGLRLHDLRDSPAWFHDETIYIGQAWNLIHGRFQWDAVTHSYLPRLPFFHAVVGSVMLLLGKDILGLRLVSALSGILATWLAYRMGREAGGQRAGLFGAALYAIWPYTVLLNRWGFSYSLAGLLVAANIYFLMRRARRGGERRDLLLAGLFAGLGMATEPLLMFNGILFVFWALRLAPIRRSLPAIALALAPPVVYVVFMLLFQRLPFVQDFHTILRFRTPSFGLPWMQWLVNLNDYVGQTGAYCILGLLGLPFVARPEGRKILGTFLVVDLAALVWMSRDDPTLVYRMGATIAPPFFVAMGCLLDAAEEKLTGGQSVARPPKGRTLSASLLAAIIVLGLASAECVLLGQFLQPALFPLGSVRPSADLDKAAAWLRPRLKPDDLIVTTHVEWMFDCRVASPMLVNIQDGKMASATYYPGLIDRLLYPAALEDAKFFIAHEATPFLANAYQFTPLLERVKKEWPLAKAYGVVRIYANPTPPK